MERENENVISKRAAAAQPDGFVEGLLEKNPDIVIAKRIMEETKRVQRTPLTFDQSNHYLAEDGQGRVGALE